MTHRSAAGIGEQGLFQLIPALTLFLLALAPCGAVLAQDEDTMPYPIKGMITINPEIYELGIPAGEVRLPGELDRVVTHDEDNRRVVAKVHVRVGDNFVVMLPDGRLVGRKRKDVDATEKKFVPATHEEIAEAIIDEHGLTGFKVEKTEHFVLIYNASPDFAKITVKVMETMLDGLIDYTQKQGLETVQPDVPLPVIAFHRLADFQRYKPMPAEVAAYYEPDSNRVILKEDANIGASGRPDLVRKELLSTIAHEGCHQLLYNIGVQQRLSRWPMWLGEGIAEYMAPTEPGRKFAWKGAGQINDLRMFELETFLQKQFVKGFDGDTVDQFVRAAMLDSTGYSASWTITHYLAKERKSDFDRYMRYLSRMAPLTGMFLEEFNNTDDPPRFRSIEEVPKIDHNMVHFKAFFGDDIEIFENKMIDFMVADTKRRYESPVAEYPHIVGLALVPGIDEDKKYACFFLSEHDVAEWVLELRESLTEYEQEHAEIVTRVFANRAQANAAIKEFKKVNKRRRR